MDDREYRYRLPRWVIGALAVLGFGVPFLIFMALAVARGSWLIGAAGAVGAILGARWAVFEWSKTRIVLNSEEIRWPIARRTLRWKDIESSEVVRVLGLRYVRIVKKDGSVMWIALNEPGGAELRRRLLDRLGLE